MVVTTEWMKENFDKFNAEFFNNELPSNKVILETSRRFIRTWGQAFPKQYGYYKIRMNSNIDMTENAAKSTLIHEMIHIYDFVKGGKGPAHGPFFQKECARINKLSNNEYTLQTYVTKEAIHTSKSAKINTVYVFKTKKDGKIEFIWTKASSFDNAIKKYLRVAYDYEIMSINEYKTNSTKILGYNKVYGAKSRVQLNKKFDLHRTVKYKLVNNIWTITERNEKTIEKYTA